MGVECGVVQTVLVVGSSLQALQSVLDCFSVAAWTMGQRDKGTAGVRTQDTLSFAALRYVPTSTPVRHGLPPSIGLDHPHPPLTCFHTWYGESENMRLAGNEVRVPTVHTKPGGPGYPRLPRTTRMEEASAPNETNVGIRGDLECTYRPHQSTDKTRNWLRQRGHRHPCDISPPGTACHSSAGCR